MKIKKKKGLFFHEERKTQDDAVNWVYHVGCLWSKSCISCTRSKQFKKAKVSTNRSSSLPQKRLRLKRLVGSPAFNSVTLWHHTASPCHTCVQLYTEIHGRTEDTWRLKTRQSWSETQLAGSGMCVLTNQGRLGIQEGDLKETGAKPAKHANLIQ